MTYRKRKSIRAAILVFATATILVPAAQAHVDFGSKGESAGYSPQALKAMTERWNARAEAYKVSSGGYSAQALKAMTERWNAQAAAYQASISPDNRGGIRGVGQTPTTSDLVDRQLANIEAKSVTVTHVDDRAGIHGPGPVETPVLVTSHGDGFDWTDAGVGASVVLFVAAMLAVALFSRRRPGIAV
jgi:hypothetical protein